MFHSRPEGNEGMRKQHKKRETGVRADVRVKQLKLFREETSESQIRPGKTLSQRRHSALGWPEHAAAAPPPPEEDTILENTHSQKQPTVDLQTRNTCSFVGGSGGDRSRGKSSCEMDGEEARPGGGGGASGRLEQASLAELHSSEITGSVWSNSAEQKEPTRCLRDPEEKKKELQSVWIQDQILVSAGWTDQDTGPNKPRDVVHPERPEVRDQRSEVWRLLEVTAGEIKTMALSELLLMNIKARGVINGKIDRSSRSNPQDQDQNHWDHQNHWELKDLDSCEEVDEEMLYHNPKEGNVPPVSEGWSKVKPGPSCNVS